MHAPPFSEQFNNNVAEPFNDYIHKLPQLMFCLDGHGHHIRIQDLYDDGTIFYMTASAKERKYYIFTITVMRLLIFRIFLLLFLMPACVQAQQNAVADTTLAARDTVVKHSRYDKRIHRYRRYWGALIPTQTVLQTCGNMGLFTLEWAGIMASINSGRRSCSSATYRNMTPTVPR